MTVSKTWWGEALLNALEEFTETGRLSRGRAYAKDHRLKHWQRKNGIIQAKLRGNVNPYYGVYKEPTYKVEVQMTHLSAAQWKKIIARLTEKASFIAKLLVDEIPENIEQTFAEFNCHLLPQNYHDFKVSCSCPDYAVPCKHIAGVCYRLASIVDNQPLVLFEMRGISAEKLHQELIKSPLGEILAQAQSNGAVPLLPVDSYYHQPLPAQVPEQIELKKYWYGKSAIPKELPSFQVAQLPATLIKKGGDYPPFWQKQASFIETMEDFYTRMRKNIDKQI